MRSQMVQFCSKCFRFHTQRFLCSPCALLSVDAFRVIQNIHGYVCAHVCIHVVQSTMCYQASGEAIRGLLGLFGFSADCHSLRARCKKNTSFLNQHEHCCIGVTLWCRLIYIILNCNDSCCFSKFQWNRRATIGSATFGSRDTSGTVQNNHRPAAHRQ